jgi:hypothetical protein
MQFLSFNFVVNFFTLKIVLFVFILILIIVYIYLRISYGFWFYQPVFHIYDFYSYLFPCGIVERDLPDYTKFTNLEDISMFTISNLITTKDYKWKQFVNFIGGHYHRNKENVFLPRIENVNPYFTNHTHQSFITFYYEKILLENVEKKSMIPSKKIISTMTSRPIQIIFNRTKNKEKIFAYYIDYLCVHKDYRKKGIAPEIIQTHYYLQRRNNMNIHANLFKREGDLTGIVPLCVYLSHVYPITDFIKVGYLNPEVHVVECTKSNIHYLSEFMKENRNLFDITICVEVPNLLDLINSQNYLIYFILTTDTSNIEKIKGCFIFKKTSIFIDKNQELVSCIGSIKDPILKKEDYFEAFKIALGMVKLSFSHLMIENISHNNILVENLQRENYICYLISPMAYFFHNFVFNTILANKVIIVGT